MTLATIRRQPIMIPNMRKVEQSERRLAVSGDILRLSSSSPSEAGRKKPSPGLATERTKLSEKSVLLMSSSSPSTPTP